MEATIVCWDYTIVSGYDFGLTTQGYHSGAAIINNLTPPLLMAALQKSLSSCMWGFQYFGVQNRFPLCRETGRRVC